MTYRIICEGRGFYFAGTGATRPIVVTRRGTSAQQPGGRHPFWRAVALWEGQGRRISADGLCVWDEARTARPRRSEEGPRTAEPRIRAEEAAVG